MDQPQSIGKGGFTTLNISVTLLTTTFANFAKRARTSAEKHYLFSIVEGLGTNITQNTRGGTGAGGGGGVFNHEEWMSECGVDPQWATLAA
jgi:hypothetical protein